MPPLTQAIAPSVVLASWTAFALGLVWQARAQYVPFFESPHVWLANALMLVLAPVALCLLFAFAWRGRAAWTPRLAGALDAHTAVLDALPASRLGLWIALAAGAGLFGELMIIRVHSSCFHLFGYYKNVSLLSCFLGLGIGYALGSRGRVATPLVLPGLALQVMLLHSLRLFGAGDFLQNPVTERVALGLSPVEGQAQALTVYGFVVAVFTTNALCFVPLGHLASRLMLRLDRLVAYGWNLVGSIIGIALFSLLSFAWTPPSVWILLPAAALLPLLRRQPVQLFASVGCVTALVVVLGLSVQPQRLDLYSPYQILTVNYESTGPTSISVNNAYFQRMLDLSPETTSRRAKLRRWAAYYSIPYRLKPRPERVLVVGAGSGNDVAAALRHGAAQVDAVEIDPAILQIGRAAHPEMPYASPRVRTVVDDARSFLRHSNEKYDLIVYGLLDSHTLLSGLSNVRLDSYVYTVEALREARAHLKEGGVLSLSFSFTTKELGRKIFLMLQEAFDGVAPRVVTSHYDWSVTFLTGDPRGAGNRGDGADGLYHSFSLPQGMNEVTARFADPALRADVSTDDWPFLYMPRRTYPRSYVFVVAALIAASLLLIRQFLQGSGTGFSLPCFFLGAGFMLLETKSITELALVFGSTWVVVSTVVTAILLLGFGANLVVARIALPRAGVVYPLLLVSLVLCWRLSGLDLSGVPPALSRLLLTVFLTLPLFFAGMAFSTELKTSAAVPGALSANLIGSMLGGFLEYNSMYFGFESLWFLALAMYAAAFASSLLQRARAPA